MSSSKKKTGKPASKKSQVSASKENKKNVAISSESSHSDTHLRRANVFTLLIGCMAGILIFILFILGVVYLSTPSHLRNPEFAHHHFRIQMWVEGEYIDFGQDRFQEGYDDTSCGAGLTETPIHFHDNKDQLVHIHWDRIRGGEVLKYYGMNRIGGPDGYLGFRFDTGLFDRIPIFDNVLPESNQPMYVYQILEDGTVVERSYKDFLDQDLETFFGRKSSLTIQREEVQSNESFNFLAIKANAHNDVSTTSEEDKEYTEQELREINNLLGDVLIYIQNEKPSPEKVEQDAQNFVELGVSSCGG